MSRRASIEARIIEWFETAELAKVEVVHELVRAKVKARVKLAAEEKLPLTELAARAGRTKRHTRRSRVEKAEGGTVGKATSFDYADEKVLTGPTV